MCSRSTILEVEDDNIRTVKDERTALPSNGSSNAAVAGALWGVDSSSLSTTGSEKVPPYSTLTALGQVVLWCLSPLSGRASLRILSEGTLPDIRIDVPWRLGNDMEIASLKHISFDERIVSHVSTQYLDDMCLGIDPVGDCMTSPDDSRWTLTPPWAPSLASNASWEIAVGEDPLQMN